MVALQQTLVIPAVPSFPKILGTSPSNVSWVVTATLLTGAVATPVVARLADLFGKRNMLRISMGIVLLGSLIAPFGGLAGIILGRALQGIGTAIVPVCMALMRDWVTGHRMGSALSLCSAMLGIGGGVGIPIGGAVMQALGWQSLFWVSAALAAIAVASTWMFVPSNTHAARGKFDIWGAVVLAVGLICLLLAVSKGGAWGWGSATTLVLFAVGAVVTVYWTVHQFRVDSPLVDLRTAIYRPIGMTNLASLLLGFAMFTNLLVTTLQLQGSTEEHGFMLAASLAGMAMLPSAIVSFFMAPVCAWIARRFSARFLLILGAAVIGASYLLRWGFSPSVLLVLIWATVSSAGIAMGYAALPMLIVEHCEPQVTAGANGFNALLRAVGTAIASSVVAAMGSTFAATHGGHVEPSWTAHVIVFVLGAVVAGLVILFSLLIPNPRNITVTKQLR